jgi:signal transduction histidine kinase/CheY-like chemotaxis protein
MEHEGRVHASLAVAAVAQALGARHVTVDRASPGVHTLRLADASVPVDAQGNLLLHFRGGRNAFPRVSAAEILTGRLPPRSLRDKVVFLDTSALGIHKVLATPLDPLLPAVEVHATAVDSMLRGDVLVRPGWASAAEMALVLVLGGGAAWLVARLRSGAAGLLLVALVGALTWLGVAWMFHGAGIVLSPLFPTMALAASFTIVTMLNVARERQRAAGHLRAAAELSAQMDERRRREEAARDANLAKSEFLSRMSHEFRTPLNAILGFSQLLQMDALTPDQREGADHIVRAGRHLLFLIEEILDISRIEAGRIRLFPEPVPVAETVERCLGLIGPLGQARGIELRSEGINDEWHVHADPKRLDQVLLNMLSNAVKYNREDGTVTVVAHAGDTGRLRLSVTDTGPGIAPEKLPLLFTPFERLGAERTGVEGTGLGLALSKQLVEAMGGAMTVASAPGDGTTFTIELGVADPAGPDPGGSPGPAQAAATRQDVPLTIVCIDDDAASLRLVEAIVARRANTRLITAAGGRAGLDLSREQQPDLVLLDRHLPDMSGDDVLRDILEDSRTKHIAVVLLSANASPTDVERLVASGAHAYFTKPLDVTDLMSVLDELAARKRGVTPQGIRTGGAARAGLSASAGAWDRGRRAASPRRG